MCNDIRKNRFPSGRLSSAFAILPSLTARKKNGTVLLREYTQEQESDMVALRRQKKKALPPLQKTQREGLSFSTYSGFPVDRDQKRTWEREGKMFNAKRLIYLGCTRR
jgi:hypothetical protein